MSVALMFAQENSLTVVDLYMLTREADDEGYVQGLARVRPPLNRAFIGSPLVFIWPSFEAIFTCGLHAGTHANIAIGRDVGLQRHRGNCLVHSICVYMINATIANVFSSYASPLICSIAGFLNFGLLFHGCEHRSAHSCQLPRLPACFPAATKFATSPRRHPGGTKPRRPVSTFAPDIVPMIRPWPPWDCINRT